MDRLSSVCEGHRNRSGCSSISISTHLVCGLDRHSPKAHVRAGWCGLLSLFPWGWAGGVLRACGMGKWSLSWVVSVTSVRTSFAEWFTLPSLSFIRLKVPDFDVAMVRRAEGRIELRGSLGTISGALCILHSKTPELGTTEMACMQKSHGKRQPCLPPRPFRFHSRY